MLQPYFSADGLRAVLVFIFAIAQAVMAYLPEIQDWEQTIAKRSQKLDTLVVPFGPFFAIWLVIFSSCIGFAIWHGLPSHLSNPVLQSVGWLAAALFAANTLWEYYIVQKGFDRTSVAIVAVELIVSLAIVARLSTNSLMVETGSLNPLGTAPLYFLAGWVLVAAFVSFSSTLVLYDASFDPRNASPAAILIAIATLLAVAIAYLSNSWFYASSAAWGLLGIAVGGYVKRRFAVGAIALLSCMGVAIAPSLSNIL